LQRIMPIAPAGIYATNSIAFPKDKAIWYSPTSPAAYENYLMIKKYECLKGYNKLQPEGATGCWVYFSVNKINGNSFTSTSTGGMKFYNSESDIKVLNIEMQTDAAGNKIIYTNYRPDEIVKSCYYFSARKGLPVRKITNKELFTSYKIFHEKRLALEIPRHEKFVADYEKTYNSLSAADQQKKDYRWQQLESGRKYLNKLKAEKEKIISWYTEAVKQSTINDTAYIKKLDTYNFLPEELVAPAGEGYNAWVDNLDFFDKTKPKDEPQCISLSIRRQDDELPKKNFMDIFHSQFNLDVLAKMVGEPAKKPSGINAINASLADAKITTAGKQEDKGPVSLSFDNSADGQFPSGWLGMKNAEIQSKGGSKWLTLTKDGYWYPRQYNKEIKDNFNLSFDLQWNEDIAYNSGLFTVTLGEIAYDNIGERYRLDDNQEMYWSLYDGYAGNFSRVILWFDPYWNGGGTLSVYTYDKRESVKFSKRITLPDFFKDKNKHNIQIQRKGNGLTVIDNGKTIADLSGVFLSDSKYNLYTFSRYKGVNSDNKNDVFYLGNIITSYE
jgi:hypothetical protein